MPSRNACSKERRRWPTLGLAETLGIDREAGRVGLAQEHQSRARSRGATDAWGQAFEVRLAIVPDDVVLHGRDAHGPIVDLPTLQPSGPLQGSVKNPSMDGVHAHPAERSAPWEPTEPERDPWHALP